MIWLWALACTPEPGSAAGTLTNGRGGAVANAELRLEASDPACAPITVQTDGEGSWTASGLCGQATWTVAPADPNWYLPKPIPVGPDTRVEVWRAPRTTGVYLVEGETLTTLVTHTVIASAEVPGAGAVVSYPVEIPGEIPRITGARELLIVGDALPELNLQPLVPSAERHVLGTAEAPQVLDPWTFVGVRFRDGAVEQVRAEVRAEGIVSVAGERPLRYITEKALDAGRYALPTADGARAWLLDFGPSPSP